MMYSKSQLFIYQSINSKRWLQV